MPRLQEIPEQLRHGLVSIAFAESVGFSRQRLRGPNWRRVGCGTYVWAGIELDRTASWSQCTVDSRRGLCSQV